MNPMSHSFFEGSEKKVELVVREGAGSLLDRGADFWDRICRAARTEILSEISSEGATAYLLSESSLFVFEQKLIMLTCGRTTLHEGVNELLGAIAPEDVALLVYQRKNEAFPHRQPTSFFDDVAAMHGRLPGKAFRFGHDDEHHLYLFHLDRAFDSDPADVTIEVLMYGVDETVRREFSRERHADTASLRERTGVDRILPGFLLDDHLFQPSGYSLNGLCGDSYYTIHVTPQEQASYASFETNYRYDRDPKALVTRVLEIFRPRSFDLVLFDHGAEAAPTEEGFVVTSHVVQQLAVGYQVRFMSFHRPRARALPALELAGLRSTASRVRR